MKTSNPIHVLVVEDSPTVRQFLVKILTDHPDITVVGEAVNGEDAIHKTGILQPDLITMDVVMPDMSGIEASKKIMTSNPTPILIVTAHESSKEMNVVFEAMKAGALDVIHKPSGNSGTEVMSWRATFTQKVINLATVNVDR